MSECGLLLGSGSLLILLVPFRPAPARLSVNSRPTSRLGNLQQGEPLTRQRLYYILKLKAKEKRSYLVHR